MWINLMIKIFTILGNLYGNMKNNPKAFEYYTKCLEIKKNYLGEIHPDIAQTYNNIGSIYKSK